MRDMRLLGRRCWDLEIRLQKRDVWNLRKAKRKVKIYIH